MEAHHQQTLWAIAQEYHRAASLLAGQRGHNASVLCSYYAVYPSMWVALGDPPGHRWQHRGMVKPFVQGQWQTPPSPLTRALARGIRALYEQRLEANYRGQQLTALASTKGLILVHQVLTLVAQARHLVYEGRPT